MRVYRTCPYCDRVNDGEAATQDDAPTPIAGDVSLCWGCTKLSMYIPAPDPWTGEPDGTMVLRKLEPEEEREYEARPEVRRARSMMLVEGRPEVAARRLREGR